MRPLLLSPILAVLALAAPSGPASALTITFDSLPANGSYYAPLATSFTGSYTPGAVGSNYTRTSPFSDETTFYNSVGANSSATFGLALPAPGAPMTLASTNGPPSAGFGIGNDTFTFVWGTPDSYNRLDFYYDGSLTYSVPGPMSSPSALKPDGYLATISGLGAYNSVVFSSDRLNAFEMAALSTVPLPASLPMFGCAILALAAFGMAIRGRAISRAGSPA